MNGAIHLSRRFCSAARTAMLRTVLIGDDLAAAIAAPTTGT